MEGVEYNFWLHPGAAHFLGLTLGLALFNRWPQVGQYLVPGFIFLSDSSVACNHGISFVSTRGYIARALW